MERSSKRGKIPQQDWPSIIKRYEAGETLASIARTYDCSPPAISYILSRSRAREPTPENTSELSELAVVKPQPNETPAPGASQEGRGVDAKLGGSVEPGGSDPAPRLSIREQPTEGEQPVIEVARPPDSSTKRGPFDGNGTADRSIQVSSDGRLPNKDSSGNFGIVHVPQNGGQRRTLHLPMSNDPSPRSESGLREGLSHASGIEERFAARSAGDLKPEVSQPDGQDGPAYAYGVNGGPIRNFAEPHGARESGMFIDQALRERVDGDITAFLAAFDAALTQDTPENRAGLREATDRLLRAGARTRIELERLEARVPLPPREASKHPPPAWRSR
jgi:hypothetical protein